MRYFVIHTVPKSLISKYNTSIAGGNFCVNMINTGIFDKTYSILSTNVYGYDDPLVMDDMEVVYSKLRSKFFFTRVLGMFAEQIKLFFKIKRGSDVWLYNEEITSGLLHLLLMLFKPSVRVYILLADFTPGTKVNNRMIKLINRAKGLITLSDSTLFMVENKVIMPGLVPTDETYPTIPKPIKRNFLISGAIRERIASISLLMETFSKMPDYTLNISGKLNTEAGIEDKVKAYTSKYPNIIYHGVVSFEEFKILLDSNTFIFSTRDPSFPENQCNFPSKILEALLHNRVIISTIHYNQLAGVKYFEVPHDAEGFAHAVKEIVAMSDDELSDYCNQSELVMKSFSPEQWRKCVETIEKNRK